MQCSVFAKCTFISSICKVNDAHEQEAIKNFHQNEKKSHIWYFVQEWIRYKKIHFKTLYRPTPPYFTAKLYLDWILKRWNIVFKGVVLIASLKSQHRSDLCHRASNPNNSLRCVQWRRIRRFRKKPEVVWKRGLRALGGFWRWNQMCAHSKTVLGSHSIP